MNVDLNWARNHLPKKTFTFSAHQRVHGAHVTGRINTWVALKVTRVVGTMWCAYLFAAFALTALPQAIESGNLVILVNWFSSNFAQLVLLPLIMVGQQVLQTATDARAEADHLTLTALKLLNDRQLELLEEIRGGKSS